MARDRIPEPTGIGDQQTRSYLHRLIQTLRTRVNDIDNRIFNLKEIKIQNVTDSTINLGNSGGLTLADASNNNMDVVLPLAREARNEIYYVKKIDGSANSVTIKTQNNQTIDGSTTQTISTQYKTFSLISDGSNWWMLD